MSYFAKMRFWVDGDAKGKIEDTQMVQKIHPSGEQKVAQQFT